MQEEKNNTVEESCRSKYDELSAEQKHELKMKLLYAVDHDDTAVMYAMEIVRGAESKGVYDNWKCPGNADVIGDVTLS